MNSLATNDDVRSLTEELVRAIRRTARLLTWTLAIIITSLNWVVFAALGLD
jgi:hypothetical protein